MDFVVLRQTGFVPLYSGCALKGRDFPFCQVTGHQGPNRRARPWRFQLAPLRE